MSPYQKYIQQPAKYAAALYVVKIVYWFPYCLKASDKMPFIHCAREDTKLQINKVLKYVTQQINQIQQIYFDKLFTYPLETQDVRCQMQEPEVSNDNYQT